MGKEINYYKLSLSVIIIGTLLRFILAVYHHPSGDACWHFSAAKFISEDLQIPFLEHLGRAEPFWAPPMFHFIAAFFFELADGIGMKLVSPLFGSLTLFYVFLIARKLYNEKIAFFSAFFLTFLPIHIDYSVFGYVESLLTFFIVLSIYLAMENKPFFSAIIFGFALLTKYNAAFILPVLLYVNYKNADANKKKFLKNTVVFLAISLMVSLPWFIRNYTLLGNPVWPFLGFLFKSSYPFYYNELSIGNFFNIEFPIATYLGFFGVPDGNYKTLFFFQIPFFSLLLALWLIGTLCYLYPFIRGLFHSKKILYIWMLSFCVLLFLYIANAEVFVSRIIIPITPAMAIVFGVGFNRIKNRKLVLALILCVALGFVLVETTKIVIAAQSWSQYKGDFNWVMENTPKESTFLVNRGQCFTYNFNRPSVYYDEQINPDFVWVNQGFKIDPASIYNQTTLAKVQEGELIYYNDVTGTKIYRAKNRISD